jgi:hypothetical protein
MQIQRSSKSDTIKKMLQDLESKEIRVGFFETAKYPDGTPIAYVAAIQEFGYGPIPPRPFMRPAELQNKNKWQRGIAAGVKAALNGAVTIDHALEQVGMVAASDVRKAIKAVTSPPLAESTIRARQSRKKGKKAASAKPLVDTGQMLQAVTSAVVNK